MSIRPSDRATGADPGAGTRVEHGKSRPRLSGVDIARVLAIAGMVMVHFGPTPAPDTTAGNIYDLSHGRASVLFALLAGVGVALLFHRRASSSPLLGRGRILLRGALLLPIGLWLQNLDHGVLVILHYYAIYFVFAALIVGLPDRWLIAGAGSVLAFGPLIYLTAESYRPAWFEGGATALGDPAVDVARSLLLTGSYPLVTWAAPLLVGVWVGRRNLSSHKTRWLLLAGGLTIALTASMLANLLVPIVDPEQVDLVSNEPHSQMPLWMAGAIGSASAVLGGMLLLSDLLRRAAWPLVAAGQLALSIYVGHLFLLHEYEELVRREDVSGAFISVGVFMVVTIAICTVWRSVFSRGPLEALLGVPWWLVERLSERINTRRHQSSPSREQA